ncbi:MAG TPA: S41 family peptidase [Phycisphaerae bacterium]|nr:S41 family peptidase [Phycisphaerae bacterium]HNU43858.1 S41 family peptidase [Phycisphaerae bacterium]
MDYSRQAKWALKYRGLLVIALVAWLCVGAGPDQGPKIGASQTDAWQRTVNLVSTGKFTAASDMLAKVSPGAPLIQQVNTWLAEQERQLQQRRALDAEDMARYVGYAQARFERLEYKEALDWVWAAKDVAEDGDAFLATDWVVKLMGDAWARAQEAKAQGDWETVLQLSARLLWLKEREKTYENLQREALTHVRLEAMFEKDYDWREALENVRWEDAQRALEHVDAYYVELPDFRKMAVMGLEQALLLSESKSAQRLFARLGNENDRADFRNRVQVHLERLRTLPSVDRRELVDTFRRVVKTINPQTVNLPEELLVSEMMRGACEPLDDFTTVIWPRDFDEFEKHTRGDFIGVGISIIKNRAEEIEVQSPLDDTPAYRAGIQAGDVVIAVDGQSIQKLSLTKVVDIITGPPDTPVTLTIRRGGKELEFPLTRTKVKIQSVKGYMRDADEHWNYWIDEPNRIGYVYVNNFQRNTPEDVFRAVRDLQANGLQGLILDLRGNPGGLLSAAFDISALFLPRGAEVVSTRGREASEDQRFTVPFDGPFRDVPTVVLTDEFSASASEIVAGALRDNGRALAVGSRTFGKFSVQNLIPLSATTRASIKVTTARYYLPSGACLHRSDDAKTWGVEPDIEVKLVRAEKVNVLNARRERDRLGPPPPPKEVKDASASATPTGTETTPAPEAAAGAATPPAPPGSGLTPTLEDLVGPPDLPALTEEDLDENKRPKIDPQLDTALLVMRIRLLGEQYPTLADATRIAEPVVSRP